eukprot:3864791-Amphidinium_carterae.1
MAARAAFARRSRCCTRLVNWDQRISPPECQQAERHTPKLCRGGCSYEDNSSIAHAFSIHTGL